MHTKTLAAAVVALTVALTTAACGDSGTETTTATSTTPAVTSATAENDTAHNQADVMFAQMMIPHHAQAVEMSDIVLADQNVPEPVRALAEQIKAAQGQEIDQLTAWLGAWGEPVDIGHGADHGMEGMLREQDMRALADAQGVEAARLFLTRMIVHHEGAIAMADTEIEEGRYSAAVAMAREIADTQQQEIDRMRQLLTTL